MPEVGRSRIASGTGDVSFTNSSGPASTSVRRGDTTDASEIIVRSVLGNNLGSGSPLFRGSNGVETVVLDFRTLLAGDGIEFEEGADTLRLIARFSGSLEDSGVTEGTYVAPMLVINKKGIITSATPTQVITEIEPMAGTGIVVAERDGTTLRTRRIRGEANSGVTTANIGGDIVIGLSGVARAVVGTNGVSVAQALGTYSVGLQATGVTAGTYAFATVSVDSFGRLTAVAAGSVTGSILLGTGSGAPVGSFQRIDIPGAIITPDGTTATLVLPTAPIQNIVNRPGQGAGLLASLTNATASLRRIIGSGGITVTEGPDEITVDGVGTQLTVQNGSTNLGQFPILRFAGAGVTASDASGGVALITIPGETVSNYLNLGGTDPNTAQIFESVQNKTARFRRVVGVGGIVINQNATDIFIDGSNISGGGSGVGSLNNLGSTGGNSGQVFESTQAGVARLRRIVGTGGLAISQNTTDIVIDGSAIAASGQVGVGLQGMNVGSFSTILFAGNGVSSISPAGGTAVINTISSDGQNIGSSGAGVFESMAGATLRFRRLRGAGGVTVSQGLTDILIDASAVLAGGVTATALSSQRNFAITGAVTGSALSDLTTGVTINTNLSTTGVVAGTYTSANLVVGADGRIYSVSSGSGGITSSAISTALGFMPYNPTVAGSVAGLFTVNGNATVTGTLTANAINGNSATASALNASRTFALSGDVSGSVSSDLSTGYTLAASLPNIGTPGSYAFATITTDSKGRVTQAMGNTPTNRGSGFEVYVAGSPLQFRTLRSGGNVNISATADEIVISAGSLSAGGGLVISNLGLLNLNTAHVFDEASPDGTAQLRRLNGSADVLIQQQSSDVLLSLSNTGVAAGTYAYAMVEVDQKGRIRSIQSRVAVAAVQAGTGIVVTGTLANGSLIETVALAASGVTAGTYTNSTVVVDPTGRVTSAANGPAPITAFSVVSGDLTVSGGNVAAPGGTVSLTMPVIVAAGTYDRVAVDEKGRVTAGVSHGYSFSGDVTGEVVAGSSIVALQHVASGVVAGTYSMATIVVDSKGRVTSASTNSFSAGVTSVALAALNGVTIVGGPITSEGVISVGLTPSGVNAGTYSLSTIVVDSMGRITSAFTGVGGGAGVAVFGSADILVTPDGTLDSEFYFSLSDTGVVAATYVLPTMAVDRKGRVRAASSASLGAGLAFANGSLGLTATGVTPGTYQYASVAVGTDGRVTFATMGATPVTSVSAVGGSGVTIGGSPITSIGTFTVGLTASGVTPGIYDNPSVQVDQFGRVTDIVDGNAVTTTLIGDASGFGTGTVPVVLAPSGVNAGTYGLSTIVVDGKGRVISASSGGLTALAGPGVTIAGGALSAGGTFQVALANSGVTAGSYAFASVQVDQYGRVTAAVANEPVTRVVASVGTGLTITGDTTITSTGTFSFALANTTVTPGSYTVAALTVDAQGRITNIISGHAGTVNSVALALPSMFTITSGPVTTTGTLVAALAAQGANLVFAGPSSGGAAAPNFRLLTAADLPASGATAGTYALATIVVDDRGRITSALTGTVAPQTIILDGDVSGNGVTGSTVNVLLAASGVVAGTYGGLASMVVDEKGRVTRVDPAVLNITGANGIAVAGAPTTGGGTYTVSLGNSGVSPGTYSNPTITVDEFGRILLAVSGSAPGGGSISGVVMQGSPDITVTPSGTQATSFALSLATTGITAGTYERVVVDSRGRVIDGSNPGYLTANQTITLSGDATGSGGTAVAVTLASTGVVAGTYSFSTITVDSKGRVTSASTGVIPDPVTTLTGDVSGVGTGTVPVVLAATGVAAGTYTSVSVDTKGRVLTGTNPGFITGNQTITLSGDATGSGGTAIALTLASTGVLAGTYSFATVSVDAKGRVTSAASAPLPPAVTRIRVTGGNDIEVFGDTTITSQGTFSVRLRESFGEPGQYNTVTVSETGLVIEATNIPYLQTAVTTVAISAGAGITTSGSPITTAGTLTVGLATSGVSAGTYAFATVTVDEFGRVTSAAGNTVVQSVAAVGSGGVAVTGGPITSNGTLAVSLTDTGVAAGTYAFATVTVDEKGRITAAQANSAPTPTTTLTGDATGFGTGTVPVVLANTGVAAGTYTSVNVDAKGRVLSGTNPGFITGNQTITLSGDATGSGETAITVTLGTTGVAAGSYALANITVDGKGRVTAASAGQAVTSVGLTAGAGVTVTGGPITSSGNITVALTNVGAAGTFAFPTITLDAQGRVTSAVSGTAVTNVGLSLPAIFNVAGSPITSAGTLAATLANQNANLFFAGPASGGAAAPTFRALVADDLPTSGVTQGAYSFANVTVDAYGRVTAITSGSAVTGGQNLGAGSPVFFGLSGTTAQFRSIIGTSGRTTIANDAAQISVDLATTSVVAGSYTNATVVVDAYGRLTFAASGTPSGVTNVGLTMPSIFTVSGSPVTTAGTFGVALIAQNANLVFAGPASGGSAAPDFRALATADLPASGVTAGTYSFATITVDDRGRITAATSGTPGTVTSVAAVGGTGVTITGGPITTAGTLSVALQPTGASAGTYSFATVTLDSLGRVTSAVGNSAVTSVNATGGTGVTITGGPITSTGNLLVSLQNSGVTPGTYSLSTIVVDAFGRVTSATAGSAGAGGGSGTVTSVNATGSNGINVSGGPITTSGSLTVSLNNTSVTQGSYSLANLTVDAQGRLTAASSTAVVNRGSANAVMVSSPGTIAFKTLRAGSNISITDNGSELTVAAAGSGVTIHTFRINFAAATSTPVNTSAPTVGLPANWSVSAVSSTSLTITVPSGTFGAANWSAAVVFGGPITTPISGYTMRPANSASASNIAVAFNDTTMHISNITWGNSGGNNTADPHVIVRITV